jgi:hypothetical protein
MNINAFFGDLTKVSWFDRLFFPGTRPRVILMPENPNKNELVYKK